MANPPLQTPAEKKPYLDMAQFAAWRTQQTDYSIEYYYLVTPRHVRWIEAATKWLLSSTRTLVQVLEWCESKKTRVAWPKGKWGNDLGSPDV